MRIQNKRQLLNIPEGYLFDQKSIIGLIIPLIIDYFLTFFVGMLDSIMVSSVNASAVSGVSLVDQTMMLVIMVFSAMATGGTVIAGQFLGARKKEDACRSVQQLVWLMFLSGIMIAALVLIFRHAILSKVFGQITAQVYTYADRYLIITAFSIPMMAVHQAGTAVFRTQGNSKNPMMISAMMNLLNFAGNATFIYGFHMDTDGAGFSTLISRSAAAIIVTIMLLNQDRPLHYERTLRYRPDGALIKKILYVGVPNGVENGMFQLGKILLLSLVSMYGTHAIAANAITQNVAQLQLIPALAVNLAVITIIARCVGNGDNEQTFFYSKLLMKITYAILLGAAWLLFLAMPLILKLYHANPETASIAMTMMRWHTFGSVTLWPLAFEVPQRLRAAGDVKFTMYTSLITMWFVRTAGAYVLAYYFGVGAAAPWITMFLDFCFRTVIYQFRWRSGKWMDKKVI